MYLGPKQVGTNFKKPPNPNKAKPLSAAEKREGNSKAHLALVRQLPCCVCGHPPKSDPHHLKIKSERGVSLRATDRWALPLCRTHHDEVQPMGAKREEAYFLKHHVSCYVLSRALWNAPRDLESLMKIIEAHR